MSKMSAQTKNTLLVILILVVATVYYYFNGANTTGVVIGETNITLSGPEMEPLVMDFDDITTLELLDTVPEMGEMLSGTQDKNSCCGSFRNEQWGEYQAFLSAKVECCILMQSGEKTALFSFESDETTREFYRSFTEYLTEQKAA